MFFVGFTPQERARVAAGEDVAATTGRFGQRLPLREPAPLTDLEGIDLYDRTRLAEEGINNIEGLAHADIVDLMSSTRISAAQLVDWTDQAILYLRVGGDLAAKDQDRRRTNKKKKPDATSNATNKAADPAETAPTSKLPPDVHANLAHLRSYGIRTATDLLAAYEQAVRRGNGVKEVQWAEVRALRHALKLPTGSHDSTVSSIQTIIDTLPDEEWFVQVRNWRDPEFSGFASWYSYLDGDGRVHRPSRSELPTRVAAALVPPPSVPMVSPSRPTSIPGSINGGSPDHVSAGAHLEAL